MAKKEITIIAGHDNNEQREKLTLDWLRKHNVTIEEYSGLQVLTLLAEKPSEGQYRHQWVIGFDNAEGDQEESYLVITLEPDPYDTRIEVSYEGSYSCRCKGLGCVGCNGELAAMKAGKDPYSHHRE